MGQDIDDSVVSRVEGVLGTTRYVSRAAETNNQVIRERRCVLAASAVFAPSRKNSGYKRIACLMPHLASASKRLFMVPDDASPAQSSEEDVPFKIFLKGREVIFPALGCGVLLVLAYGPRNNFSIKDIQAASGIALFKVESLVVSMLRGNALQQDKAINGVATFSIAFGCPSTRHALPGIARPLDFSRLT